VQELLDALAADQRAVQFPKIHRAGEFRHDICSEFSAHSHTHRMDTRPRILTFLSFSWILASYPLPANQTLASFVTVMTSR
jgi:hypothetical protein